ncbi:MAG: hydrogenase maturation protease [Sulfuricellaceae bacterium]|nr:hydrogenase maturation protease [Sulfuricellaceae bacterium]
MPRLCILICGNPSRGDDALGPLIYDSLASWPDAQARFKLVADFQLQVEHAVDLLDSELVLFIDASVSCAAPYQFSRLRPSSEVGYTTHVMSPAAVLEVYRQVYGQEPPPSYLLTVRGESFVLGEGLSPAAAANMEAALAYLERLCDRPDSSVWTEYCNEIEDAHGT